MLRTSQALATAALALASSYDYQDIVSKYCNPPGDWGPLPPRPEGVAELLQVQTFIRHGARVQATAPTSPCWSDGEFGSFECKLHFLQTSIVANEAAPGGGQRAGPLFMKSYLPDREALRGNCMAGQLVEAGLTAEINNGKRLREAYVERERFLPPSVVDLDLSTLKSLMRLRSTDVPRTQQSGMALLTGIYGEENIGSLPYIPLWTMDMSMENMLLNKQVCPALQSAQDEFFATWPHTDDLLALCAQEAPLGPARTVPSECFTYLTRLVDCMMSRLCPNVPFKPDDPGQKLPERFRANDNRLLRQVWKVLDEAQFAFFNFTAKVGIGPFLAEVLAHAKAAVEAKESPLFLLFSGHDTGPMEPMWAALNLRPEAPYWPPFASMTVLEIWSSTKGPMIRWISNGQPVGGLVPFSDFEKVLTEVIPCPEECKASASSVRAFQLPERHPGQVLAGVGGSASGGASRLWETSSAFGLAGLMLGLGSSFLLGRLCRAPKVGSSTGAEKQQDSSAAAAGFSCGGGAARLE